MDDISSTSASGIYIIIIRECFLVGHIISLYMIGKRLRKEGQYHLYYNK